MLHSHIFNGIILTKEDNSMNYSFNDFLLRLQQAKSSKKLRVEDVSKLSGIPLGTVSKIFAGITTDPKINTVISIAEALEISPDYLIYGKNLTNELSDNEYNIIKKYRQLDADGKKVIDETLDFQLFKASEKAENKEELLG